MMKRLVAVLALIAATVPVHAAPPSAAQKDEFYKVCFGISQDAALCSCKADAAPKLIDGDFMEVVIAAMKGVTPPEKHYVAYNTYIGRSNQVCKPNY